MVKSMFAAVAGLRAHQSKMDIIGNNIANVNTPGFKKARATFKDQFYATLTKASSAGETYGGGNPSQLGYGSQIGNVDVNFGSGGVAATDLGMDVLIDGNGFFLVGEYNEQGFRTTSKNDGSGRDSLTALDMTRVGDFNIDGEGNLVNGNKKYVYGFRNYADVGEEPKFLKPPVDDNGVAIAPTDDNPAVKTLETIHVPKILMNASGEAITVVTGKTKDGEDILGYLYEDDVKVEKGENGQPDKITITNTNLANAVDQDVLDKAYMAPMKLFNMGISGDGSVSGVNDLKQLVVIGRVAVANVPNPNAMEAQGASEYRAGDNTGVVTAENPGDGSTGLLSSGKLELSNVDLAQEFTEMITTQRGFQANTRIITVTDEMLQELVNIKR